MSTLDILDTSKRDIPVIIAIHHPTNPDAKPSLLDCGFRIGTLDTRNIDQSGLLGMRITYVSQMVAQLLERGNFGKLDAKEQRMIKRIIETSKTLGE